MMAAVSKLAAAAFAWALGASLLLLVLPVYSEQTADGSGHVTNGSATLVQENGAGVIAVLAIPVAIAAAGLALHGRGRAVAAGCAAAFVLLGGFTVGLFYAPTAILLIVAAGRSTRPPARG
jgi:hypothetical protein